MSARSFTTSFTVDQTPLGVFDAICNVRGWWSEEIEGRTAALGDEFTFRHGDVHRSTQKLIEVVPGERVVWLVLDAHLSFTEDKAEWKGTKVVFEISRQGKKTEVRFTHVGLVPQFECYGACSRAWAFYFGSSLRSLITTGKGQPIQTEAASS